MANVQVVRYSNVELLAKRAATRLLDRLISLQSQKPAASICLFSGDTAMRLYAELGRTIANSPLNPKALEIWWGDEHFLPTTDPDRLASRTLAALAGQFPIDVSLTHPMPGSQGQLDAAAAAEAYAKEIGDTVFDICVMEIGALGQTSSLFIDNPALEVSSTKVTAVRDAPIPPAERISLTTPTINAAAEVWLLASGSDRADWVKRTLSGDTRLPSGRISAQVSTCLLIDAAAAAKLPYYECSG